MVDIITPDQVFGMTNGLATLGWALLLFTPNWHITRKLLFTLLIPTLLCAAYLIAMLSFPSQSGMDFSSLDSVAGMFSQREVVLVGWIHYLAFDLMVGLWINFNARKHGIKHLYIVLPLIFTFMLGPIGLLAYLILRSILLKKVTASNFDLDSE
ncbi:MAG: ABA4-like family protein [Cyclobacteriaceae bacterium]